MMSELKIYQDITHQFDREDEVTLEKLFTSFCNHVTLGQWELARVCLRGLYERRKQLDKPLKEILRALIDQPTWVSNGSPSVTSPFHLSWLCLVEYLGLFTNQEDKLPAPVAQTVEFRFLLNLTCKTASKQIIQELDNYHCQIVYGDTSHLTSSNVAILSSSCLQFLEKLLDEDPAFGHVLISKLTGQNKHFLETNQNLQQLYLNCIAKSLDLLDAECSYSDDDSTAIHSRSASKPEREESSTVFSKHKEHFYHILSLLNPTSEMTTLSHALNSLFETLIKRTKIPGSRCLDKGVLYSCLMQRQSTFLLEKFCDIENRLRLPVDGEFGNMQDVGRGVVGLRSPVICPTVHVCLFQSHVTDRSDAWKYLYFHSLDKNHILENIVETALFFVKDGDFEKVTQLLNPAELKLLKPLVILLGWPYCYSCENARHLLDALWDSRAQVCDPLLYQACQKLAYQVQLVQWCLEKAGPLLASSESGSTHHQQASEMFQGLESHSVLHVLHKSISLDHLPEKEVFSLLRKRPVFSPAILGASSDGMDSKSSCQSEASPGGDEGETMCVHPEVERDLILYHSFCGLKNFMECVAFHVPNKHNINSSSDIPRDLTPNEGASKKLQDGREHLTHVYPLTYRVEILEDIFSLLFATYEDLYSEKIHHDSDDLDTGDDETKSLATSRTGSLESLLSITSTSDVAAAEHTGHCSPFQDQEKGNYFSPVSSSTPDSPAKMKGHSRHGSRGSKRQLFQGNKNEFEPISFEEGLKKTEISGLDRVQRIRSFAPPIVEKNKGKQEGLKKEAKRTRTVEEGELSDEEPKIGFIASDEVVAEYLRVLKDCLMDLNTAKIRRSKSGTSDIRDSPDWLRSSVASSTLEQRASRLGQYITEAQWRHQLVTWTNTTKTAKSDKSRKVGRKYRQKRGSELMEDEAEYASDEDDDKNAKPKGDRLERPEDLDVGSEESSSYQSQELTTGTEDNTRRTKFRQKRTKKPRQARRGSVSEGLVVKDGSTIARMLSSPETLIFMCMRKDSYDRSQQVIKMFEMHAKPSAQAAIFAEKYANAFKELSRLQPKARQSASRRGPAPSRTLGAVAMAAASGVTSSFVSNLIDELMTLPNLATILLPDVDCEDEAIKKSVLYRFVSPQLIPLMVCLDLACTANISWEMCKSLMETANSRLVLAEDGPSKNDSCLVDVVTMLAELSQLLVARGDKLKTKPTIPLSQRPNLIDLLSSIRPIQHQSRETSIARSQEQEESLKKMEQAVEEGDTAITRVEDVATRGKTKAKGDGTLMSFKLVEKSLAVRVALTELQKSFDCVTGVDDILEGDSSSRSSQRLDYLRTLVYHVDTLATLLLHWQSRPDDLPGVTDSPEKNRGVLMKASNPFIVLNKGIAETLGKPMFERGVSPKRLEGICKQLNINLVKVIVHNCCPHIPASGLGNSKVFRWPSSEPRVLNHGNQWLEKAREPNLVAKELLTKMMDVLTNVAKHNEGLIDTRSAAVISKSPEFHAVVQATSELQKVDLDLLQTNDSKICFFVNVINLLFAHASLVHFSKSDDDEDWDPKFTLTRHGSLTRLSSTSLGSDTEDLDRPRGVSALERISFLKHHCYDIGQMGPISAFDILFVILRSGMQPPTMFGPAIQLCYPERPADDPKRKYKLPIAEKRLIFAICDGCISSPDLQVYDVNGLDAQLHAAAVTYINPRITIDVASGKVLLPEYLSWHKNDLHQSPLNDLDLSPSQSSQEPDISFLLQLEPFLLPNTANQLRAVLPSVKKVTYRPFCWSFGYRFEISSLDHSDSSSNLQRSSSFPDSLYLSMEYSTSSMRSIDTRGQFSPNEATLEYLKKTSPLMFTLVELVCGSNKEPKSRNSSFEVINQGKAQDMQPDGLDKPANSNEPVFSSILKRTASFPALQRYLASRLYCLSELLVGTAVETDMETGSYELVRRDSRVSREYLDNSSPQIHLSSLALSAEDACQQQYACQKASDHYLKQGNFDILLELITTSCFHGDGSGSRPVDFLLTSAVLSRGGLSSMFVKRLDAELSDVNVPPVGFTHKWQKKPWSLLAQIKDNEHLAQLVLSKMREYKAKDASDMLNLALSRLPRNTALRKELEHRKKELNLHVKIARCAKTHQYKTPEANSFALLTQWQGVAVATPEEPDHVMNFLLSIQQYELAADWAEMHGLPHAFHKAIKENHLKHLLESRPEDTMKAYRILEGIQEQHMALEVCDSLLMQSLHVSQTLFVIQFMLTNLRPHLSPIRIEQLLLTKMGAKALLCIPDTARPAYEHLVSRPNLLLEQLLMNLKVEWAARVFNRLQVDLALMGEDNDEESTKHHGCTVKVFDSLLARYAAKALEFQVVQPETNQEKPASSQAFHPTPSSSPTPSITSFGGRHTPIPITGRETPIPGRADISKDKVVDQESGRGSLQRSISSIAADTLRRSGQPSYVPPAIPPRKGEWMPDAQALECIICKEPFNMFNRRHHCRRCGRVVCGTCSKHTSIVQGFGKTAVRVCDTCYEHFYGKKMHKEQLETAHSSPASNSPARPGEVSSLEKSVAQDSVVGSYTAGGYVAEAQTEAKVANIWKLSLEPENNMTVRDEFYYEQAPSSSLCIAILDLHSDNTVCGRLLLDLCNTLSKKLVPITPGVRNEEVDHNLIISMIRYLLFNAKLKMIKAGETQGVELCDTYLGHVELMKFLVESNCGDIPSLQDLIRPDSARRLRDRFIEDERLTLAMEVSTKCGLDPSGVWAAAGFACLQAGDMAFARDKFAKCMKPTDGKQPQNSQFLDKILDILQHCPLISFSQSTDELLSPLRGLAEHAKNVSHGSVLDGKRFDECLYYLHTYGNDASTVAFYIRHGEIRLACRYILDKKSPPEVFVESLFMRLVSKGGLSALKEQMEAADPSLQSWMTYLTAACRYLHKRGCHHLLYDLQLFMKDYFRAAQTCIRFFEGAAGGNVSTYEDLFSRLEYLSKARGHLETVIIEKKSPRGSALSAGAWLRSHGSMRRRSQEDVQHVTLTLSDLNSHVNTINLQVEVTNFIHKCLVEGASASGLRSSDDAKLPTLFGNGHSRAELAVQVLLSGSTIQDGFSLASRIIQDYNLPSSRVYVDAGRALARQYRFNHIQQLLKCVGEIGLVSDKCHDDIILACVRIVSADQNQAKHVDNLTKRLKSDSNMIEAYLLCGKLKSAYLVAVKEKRVEAIQMIAEEAKKTGQTKTLSLCRKWLEQHQKKKEEEERSVTMQRRQDNK